MRTRVFDGSDRASVESDDSSMGGVVTFRERNQMLARTVHGQRRLIETYLQEVQTLERANKILYLKNKKLTKGLQKLTVNVKDSG